MSRTTRRALLGAAATSAAAAAFKPSTAPKPNSRVLGANDRINCGFIGVGNRGGAHLRAVYAQSEAQANVQVVGVSDIYTRYKQKAQERAKLTTAQVHHDYRELLARPDIDAVFISTPDHWHCQMAIDALAAGKDVYLEKPMALTIPESRAIRDAVKQYKRVMQVGSQYLSDPRYHRARQLIADGEIGEPLWAQGTYSRNSKDGEWNYYVDEEATPESIDWKRWLGTAPKRPFSGERYFRWRKYWDYSGGIATDLFYHRLGPLVHVLGQALPTRVTGNGGIYVQKDREVPDTYATVVEYPACYINLSSSMANAAADKFFPETIYGHKATMSFAPGRILLHPEMVKNAEPKVIEVPPVNIYREHLTNFLDCLRTRQQPVLNEELGHQLMVAIKLGVDSYREGRVKAWDPQADRELSTAPKRQTYEGDGKNREGGIPKRG